LVRRHERRLFAFAFLSACIALPIVLAGYFLSERRTDALLVWIAVASWQIYLWLRCRKIRRSLEHDQAA